MSQKTPSMFPSLITGGASIIGGAIDAISNAINHKRDLKAQQEENQKNREHAEMMYKKYESPQAQAQQLAAAGLNPAAQGAVSTQSVGSASTSSLPTSSPSTLGSSIAEGAQDAVNSYTQRKQFQQQLDADALNQTRNFFLELSRLDLDRQELQVQLDLWREQIAASKVSREYQDKINKQLQEFMDNGGNTYIDDSNLKQAQTTNTIISAYSTAMDESRKAELHPYVKRLAHLQNENLSDIIYDHNIKEVGHLMGIDMDTTPPYLRGFASYAILCKMAFETGKMSYNQYERVEDKLHAALTEWSNYQNKLSNPDYMTEEARQRLQLEQSRLVLDLFSEFNPLSMFSD